MEHREQANTGLQMLKDAIAETLRGHDSGMTNTEVAEELGIESGYLGEQKNTLTWAVLGLLLSDGQVEREGRKYRLPGQGVGGQTTI